MNARTDDGKRLATAEAIQSRIGREHVADIVEYLNQKTPEEAAEIIGHMPHAWGIDVLDQPDFEAASDVIDILPQDKAVVLVEGMAADRAADVLRWVLPETKARIESLLTLETKQAIEQLLSYPENTAGSLMTTEFVSVPADWTIGETLDHLRTVERTRETIYSIYVLDPVTRKLMKSVPLRRLISGDPASPILSLAPDHAPITTGPLADREVVARQISKYDLLAIPVVDSTGHIIGIVTVDDAIDAMLAETSEDLQKLGGMEAIDEPYMQISFFGMLKKRAGWLSVLFLSEMLTASAMQHYADELEKAIVLALFVPLVMSSGGNSGSQATSLIIRSLALQEVKLKDWWRVAMREVPTGIVLGAILGVIGILRITVWQNIGLFDYGEHWKLLALTIGFALIGIVTFGSFTGSMLPFILKRLGFDPASASAPFVATLVDVTGIVIYFSIAWLMLHGTIL